MTNIKEDEAIAKTRTAYLWSSMLTTPFWVVFSMLPFILYKDLHATPLQITTLITLKPMASLFSTYWSAAVNKRRDRLLSNVIIARIVSHLPFLCFPFVQNVWFIIAAFGFYMVLYRGVIPSWMEILKINIPKNDREKVFAWGSFICYAGDAILPFALGGILDEYSEAWRWLLPSTALLSLTATFFTWRIPISLNPAETHKIEAKSFKGSLLEPWKQAWEIINKRPDFLQYQIGFMLGGGGLMLIQPALPSYFVDILRLSYTEMAVALTLCRGIGFAVTTPFWTKCMNRVNVFKLSSYPPLFICGFTICLGLAQINAVWVYIAYLFYGFMQAGSGLTWHFSGPNFAGDEESSAYTSINILAVGIRGCIIPPLGSVIYMYTNPLTVLILSGGLCWISYRYLFYASERQEQRLPA